MQYFDKKNNRIVFTGKGASPDFWDNQWNVDDFKKVVLNGKRNRLVINTTKKFIAPKKSNRILEGGCGNGQFVYAFDEMGYDSHGIDYAPKTISRIKKLFPKLNVSIGDVRKINFPDNYFDGYWSVGVIEHFFDGYNPVLLEIQRVTKPGGFVFMTFPYMSPLRKIKSKFNSYPKFKKRILKKETFYQFALDHEEVIRKMKNHGFKLVQKTPYNGTKGLKDEISFTNPILQKIYDSKKMIPRVINYLASETLSPLSGHSILLVFQKK